MVDFGVYFLDRILERQRQRTDDMLSDVIYAAQDAGEAPMTDAGLLSIIRQFLVAGNETTTNTLASAIWLFIRHPDQVSVLRENSQFYGRLAEEVLLYESPVQGLFRMAIADTELCGTFIPKNNPVLGCLRQARLPEGSWASGISAAANSIANAIVFGRIAGANAAAYSRD